MSRAARNHRRSIASIAFAIVGIAAFALILYAVYLAISPPPKDKARHWRTAVGMSISQNGQDTRRGYGDQSQQSKEVRPTKEGKIRGLVSKKNLSPEERTELAVLLVLDALEEYGQNALKPITAISPDMVIPYSRDVEDRLRELKEEKKRLLMSKGAVLIAKGELSYMHGSQGNPFAVVSVSNENKDLILGTEYLSTKQKSYLEEVCMPLAPTGESPCRGNIYLRARIETDGTFRYQILGADLDEITSDKIRTMVGKAR